MAYLLALFILALGCGGPGGPDNPDDPAPNNCPNPVVRQDPNRLIGYGVVNEWYKVDPDTFADQLACAGLNLTQVEWVPILNRDQFYEVSPNDVMPEVVKAYVEAMRARGIWTFINIANYNGDNIKNAPTSWFQSQLDYIIQEIGTDHVILQSASEWDSNDSKYQDWANRLDDQWTGEKAWNVGSRPSSAPSGYYRDWHTCDPSNYGPNGGSRILLSSDCTPTINHIRGNQEHTRKFANGVLSKGSSLIVYGFWDDAPDLAAIAGIRDAIIDQGL